MDKHFRSANDTPPSRWVTILLDEDIFFLASGLPIFGAIVSRTNPSWVGAATLAFGLMLCWRLAMAALRRNVEWIDVLIVGSSLAVILAYWMNGHWLPASLLVATAAPALIKALRQKPSFDLKQIPRTLAPTFVIFAAMMLR